MKILDVQQTRNADRATVASQNITSHDLMQRAANEAFMWIKNNLPDKETVFHVFFGQGNNGGDGLLIAKALHLEGYTTLLNIVGDFDKPSLDFSISYSQITEAGIDFKESNEISSFGKGKAVVIDAIFGIGLTRDLEPLYLNVINTINRSRAFVISIDAPSGMFMDRPTEVAVKADVVLTFQYPKLAFYFSSNYEFAKSIIILDIGLDASFLQAAHSDYHFIDEEEAYSRYKPVPLYAHKGTQGHALIIGGSYGKIGAVVLSARAALRTGSGLVTAYIPSCGYNAVQASFPEAMVITDGGHHITAIEYNIKPDAVAIGMGISQEQQTQEAFYDFISGNTMPLVLDADAVNILSYNKDWLKLLPENSVLTPHPKELQGLIGEWQDDFDRLEKIKEFSKAYKVIVVAKDARTMTVSGEAVYINSTGNSALATGGSGDVLAGIITGLIAQGYDPLSAAVFGVYLHGLTADIAIEDTGKQAFTASTILDYLGTAFLKIEKAKA